MDELIFLNEENENKFYKYIPNIDKIIFQNETHKEKFLEFCTRKKIIDVYHLPVAYLLALDEDLRRNCRYVFDFKKDEIIQNALNCGFMTFTSIRTTRLLFNLWNGCNSDTFESDEPTADVYTPNDIFCSMLAPFYLQAIMLRFPDIMRYDKVYLTNKNN